VNDDHEVLAVVLIDEVVAGCDDDVMDLAFEAHLSSEMLLQRDHRRAAQCAWEWYAPGRLDQTRAVLIRDMRSLGIEGERIAEVLQSWDAAAQPVAIIHVADLS
jgi:hypothetical protein